MRTVFPRLHHPSPKRIYRLGVIYSVTTVTADRYPYFEEPILAGLLVHNTWFAKELKQFELYGYAVLPDHMHLMFRPINHSMAMQNIKRVFSLQANQIIFSSAVGGGRPIPTQVRIHILPCAEGIKITHTRPLNGPPSCPDSRMISARNTARTTSSPNSNGRNPSAITSSREGEILKTT